MKYRKMGRTGLLVSEISLGCMHFGCETKEEDAKKTILRSRELGINHFDTARSYPTGLSVRQPGLAEEILARTIKPFRKDILITTKVGAIKDIQQKQGLSRWNIMAEVEASLTSLQTDYVDILLAHMPDAQTPSDETLRAFDDIVRLGKARYIGCSNYHPWKLCKSLWMSEKHNLARFDCIQFRYNIISRMADFDTIPFCAQEGLGLFAYNPLAGGLLAGALYEPGGKVIATYEKGSERPKAGRFTQDTYFKRYWNDRNLEGAKQLKNLAAKYGHAPTDVAIAWILSNKKITSVLSLVDFPDQMNQNVAATELTLSGEELAECNKIYESMTSAEWLSQEVGEARFPGFGKDEFAY
jgi:aryl-alcohol dehydrogenase-like predicted oxidoreductase